MLRDLVSSGKGRYLNIIAEAITAKSGLLKHAKKPFLIFPLLLHICVYAGVYPASPATWMFFLAALLSARYSEHGRTMDLLDKMEKEFPG